MQDQYTALHYKDGWGWDHFLGGVPAQSSRREASTWTFFDRFDIFSITTDATETLVSSKMGLKKLYRHEKQMSISSDHQLHFQQN